MKVGRDKKRDIEEVNAQPHLLRREGDGRPQEDSDILAPL